MASNDLHNREPNNREGEAPAEPLLRATANALPIRKHPAHGVRETDGHQTIVFNTVCTKARKPCLANQQIHDLLVATWNDSTKWLVGRYVVMPDHIHMFASPAADATPFDNWVRFWKSQFTKRIRKLASNSIQFSGWQTDHWDTRMRTWKTYDEKWEYVRNNPVRHGLVTRAEEWPFQGEIFKLAWD